MTTSVVQAAPETSINIVDHIDEAILEIAHPMWRDLIKYSNLGQYGKFIRKFSYDLLFGLNEIELGKLFANSELTRSLRPDWDYLGIFLRGLHVRVPHRLRRS